MVAAAPAPRLMPIEDGTGSRGRLWAVAARPAGLRAGRTGMAHTRPRLPVPSSIGIRRGAGAAATLLGQAGG